MPAFSPRPRGWGKTTKRVVCLDSSPRGLDPPPPASSHQSQADPAPALWFPSRVLDFLDLVGRALEALPSETGDWALDPALFPTVGYDRTNKQHHSLLLCLLMTSCDLSDQTKGWKTTRKIAVSAAAPCGRAGCTPRPVLCGSCSPNTLSGPRSAWLSFGETETSTTSGHQMRRFREGHGLTGCHTASQRLVEGGS